MRQMQNRRQKGRSNNQNRKAQNLLSKVFESNGPGVKVRGNANTVYDKYVSLARDAQTSGDYITAENYFQHAEHYKRIIIEATANSIQKSDSKCENEEVEGENIEETAASLDNKTEEKQEKNIDPKPVKTRKRRSFVKKQDTETESAQETE